MLQWLHKKLCPCDESTTRLAYQRRHYELLDWAIEHGRPCELENDVDDRKRLRV